jgi:hypothetical protein
VGSAASGRRKLAPYAAKTGLFCSVFSEQRGALQRAAEVSKLINPDNVWGTLRIFPSWLGHGLLVHRFRIGVSITAWHH